MICNEKTQKIVNHYHSQLKQLSYSRTSSNSCLTVQPAQTAVLQYSQLKQLSYSTASSNSCLTVQPAQTAVCQRWENDGILLTKETHLFTN